MYMTETKCGAFEEIKKLNKRLDSPMKELAEEIGR
jgi:hypothetical protein